MALYPELRKWLEMYEATGEFSHLLFYGGVGTGKTTAAYILAELITEDFNPNKHVIDCSYQPAIKDFKSVVDRVGNASGGLTRFMGGSNKEVYIFDEFHKLPKNTQTTLNYTLEKTEDSATCIFCVNDIRQVEMPIQSRTKKLGFDVCIYNENKDTLSMFPEADCTLDEWKEELRRVGRIVCEKNGMKPDKKVEDRILADKFYLAEIRSYIRALEDAYRMSDFYDKKS